MPFITFPPSQTKITASPHFQANYLSTRSNPYPICFHFFSLLILLILFPLLHALCIRDIEKVCWISVAHNTSAWQFFIFSFTPAFRMTMLRWLHHLEGITMVIHNAHFPGCNSACVQHYLGSTLVSFTLCTFSKALHSTFLFQASQSMGRSLP